jgi:bifunctional non-homologous end joining protein LigD
MAERFTVHQRDGARLDWRLALERDGTLAAWTLPRGVPLDPHDDRVAIRALDPPTAHDAPDGELFDAGVYDAHEWTDRKVEVTLHGERLAGRYGLFPLSASSTPPAGDSAPWMIHRLDPPSDPHRLPLPPHMAPMLARADSGFPPALPGDDDQWGYEVKWDGIRALLWSDHGHVRIESRTQREITARYPELRALGRTLGAHELLLDGELVALDEQGRPSFERLAARMNLEGEGAIRRAARAQPIHYVAFDLLHLDGRSLCELPYERRRALLDELALEGPCWRTPGYQRGGGRALLDATREQGLEGVVAKRLDSPYEPGRRSGAWRKLRHRRRQELVIGGWTEGEGARSGRVGALLLGVHDHPGAPLRYAGRVGSGFAETTLDELRRRLAPLQRARSPFQAGAAPPRGARFVAPQLLAEVEFSDWTREGLIRQSVFKGLRDDKDAADVVVERTAVDDAAGDELHDLLAGMAPAAAGYYDAIAATLLPYVRDRRARVEAGGELWVPLHRARGPARPTAVVFELAAVPPAERPATAEAALVLHELFERLGLVSVVKTCGGTGLEVHLPLGAGGAPYAQAQAFARRVAALVEARMAGVHVDCSRNDPGAVTLAPYSLCAGSRPVVSTPLTWEELRAAHAAGTTAQLLFDPPVVLARVAAGGDPFAPLLSARQSLPSL